MNPNLSTGFLFFLVVSTLRFCFKTVWTINSSHYDLSFSSTIFVKHALRLDVSIVAVPRHSFSYKISLWASLILNVDEMCHKSHT